ncbi:RDD family protein [uncultured Roseivirga sp.]|uniref:RDD family protein n=1 Tax=uncultured Roseivirga sp. TaxID=543088 RepID=UPI0030DDA927|tara:strand:- start:12538 stop:13248 length:711 start_codon:yes stop_codon:yes gene_type:complete
MQAVSIQTSQNIQLEYPLAGIGDRILAFVIDAIIILSFIFITNIILGASGISMSVAMNVMLSIVAYLYRLVSEVFFNGQTVGKRALHIKVVKLDGSVPSFSAYFLRWLMEPIDFFIMGLGVVFIILSKNGQRVGDLLAGTTVIKMKKITATNVRNKVIMETVDENYVPKIPEAAQLADNEIRLIKDALSVFRDGAKQKPLLLIEEKLKEKYNIQSDMPTVKFMYTLLRDHTYYMTK